MGGKPWSKQEERIFWRVIARQAPPGLNENRKRSRRTASQARNWAGLATRMRTLMDAAAPLTPHRNYNSIGLYEHYHHNYIRNKGSESGKYSPNAYKFVKEYEAWLNQTGGAASNGSSNAATAPQLPAQPDRCQQTSQARQAQTQTQSTYARGTGAQGVMYFNRPMPPPPTPQTHGNNMGYVGFYGLPNQYPGYDAARPFGNAGSASNGQPLHNGSTVAGGHSFNNAGPTPTGLYLNNAGPVSGGRFFNSDGPTSTRQSSPNGGPASGGPSFGNARTSSGFNPTQAVPDDQSRFFGRKQDGRARFSS